MINPKRLISIALGLLGILPCLAQMPVLNHPVYGKYDYKVVFDNTKVIGGKRALSFTTFDMDDDGNVAVLARTTDFKTCIWTSKGGWGICQGDHITNPKGEPAEVEAINDFSMGPRGELRYQMSYHAIGSLEKGGAVWVIDGKTYPIGKGPGNVASPAYFTPDEKQIYIASPGDKGPRAILLDPADFSIPYKDLVSPDLKVDSITGIGVSKTTGHFVFSAVTHNADNTQNRTSFYINGQPRPFPYPQRFRSPLLINAKDFVAFGTDDWTIYVNGKTTPYKGQLKALNDRGDVLFQEARVWMVNDAALTEVVPIQTPSRNPKYPHGLPEMPGLGAPYGAVNPVLNNKGQVAIAMQFLPVGQQIKYQMYLGHNTVSMNGLPDPWQIVVATPK